MHIYRFIIALLAFSLNGFSARADLLECLTTLPIPDEFPFHKKPRYPANDGQLQVNPNLNGYTVFDSTANELLHVSDTGQIVKWKAGEGCSTSRSKYNSATEYYANEILKTAGGKRNFNKALENGLKNFSKDTQTALKEGIQEKCGGLSPTQYPHLRAALEKGGYISAAPSDNKSGGAKNTLKMR